MVVTGERVDGFRLAATSCAKGTPTGCAQSAMSESGRCRSTVMGASSEDTIAVMFRADGFGWGTSEPMHATSTDNAGSWLRIDREVGLGCGAFDGTTRQSG